MRVRTISSVVGRRSEGADGDSVGRSVYTNVGPLALGLGIVGGLGGLVAGEDGVDVDALWSARCLAQLVLVRLALAQQSYV